MAVFVEFARESSFGGVDDQGHAEEDTDHKTDERQGGNTQVSPAADFAEGDGVGLEEEVEDAVNEGEVDSDADEDRLEHEHLEWAEKVLVADLGEGRFVFVQEGVEGPVLGLATQSGGAGLEQSRAVGLGHDEEGN